MHLFSTLYCLISFFLQHFYFVQIYDHVQHSFGITGLSLYETDCHIQLCFCFT